MLEDMLQACVLDHKGSWEEHLPLMEFTYNNSYQASIQMAPYEAVSNSALGLLYGHGILTIYENLLL